jgi:hypothetical protein
LPTRDRDLLRERAELQDATIDGTLNCTFLPQELYNLEATGCEKAQLPTISICQPEA